MLKSIIFFLLSVKDMREGEGRLDAFVITPEGKIFPSLGHWV